MDVKIDYAKLIDWYSGVQNQMNNLMMHVSALVAMEQEIVNGNAIHGSAADGIVTYIRDVHWGQIVPCITERQQELSTLITEYMAGLEQKDMSIDAIVESSYLQELETSLDTHRDQAIDILDAIRTCTNSIRHIIELNPRSTENMKCAYEALRKEASRTREDYEEYEEQAYDAINKYQEVMRNAAYQISNETHNMPDLRSYKAGTHAVDLLSSVREKAEAYPYSNLFDADRYAENVACMQEVQLVSTYDGIIATEEKSTYENIVTSTVDFIFSPVKSFFNVVEKVGTVLGLAGDSEDLNHYEEIKNDIEQWKQDPDSVDLNELSPEQPSIVREVIDGISNIISVASIYVAMFSEISFLGIITVCYSGLSLLPDNSEELSIESVQTSDKYNNYIQELYGK